MHNTFFDIPVSIEKLEELKLLFTSHLSPRRISTITTLAQLVKQLHKQNVIDTFHREPLGMIKDHLNISSAQIDLLTKDLFVDYVSKENNYALQRINASSYTDQTDKCKCSSELQLKRHQQIYKIIATEIGRKWKDLGRELEITEGILDKIELEENNIGERVYKILKEFEEYCPLHQRSAKLNQALIECRRKDLAKKIVDIEQRI